MPVFRITAPDGTTYRVTAPEGATEEEALAKVQAQHNQPTEPVKEESTLNNIAAGALKGASNIGATILAPVDALARAAGIENSYIGRNDRRQAVSEVLQSAGANPESLAFKGGELGSEIAGTAGIGGALAKGVTALKFAPRLAAALESGGFSLGTPGASQVANWATRIGAGATVGGASAGLIEPENAAAGAALGGGFPVAAKIAGMAGNALGAKVSPEVVQLWQKAKILGIDVPADRIVDSRPLNAMASSLNYVPFSGRTATEDRMISQMNKALSRTIGQDSSNVTQAVRKAADSLSAKFESVLKNNAIKADDGLLDGLVANLSLAEKELGSSGAKAVGNQIDDIMAKIGPNGTIDGQAAYNIKKTLDRLGQNKDYGFYMREVRDTLIDALNRSIGPEEAANFAKVRQQWGNMRELRKMAPNGAEGEISAGRLASKLDIRNQDLRDIADIAAQFLRSRESPHGAAQRVVLGTLGAGALGGGVITGTLPAVAAGMAAGRVANTALNSGMLKNALVNQGAVANALTAGAANPLLRSALYANASNP